MAQRKGGLFGVDPAQPGEGGTEGEGIGTLLRHRRESLGQDIAAVSRQLRIRAVYITAIEEGRLFDLPGTAYAVGFVRAYADYLGLDGNAIVGDYREELARRSRQNDLVWPAEEAVPKFPGGTILVVCALIALAGYAGWYYATQPGGTGIQLIDAVPEYIKKATGVGESTPEAATPETPASETPTPETPTPEAPAPDAAPATAGQNQGQAAPALPAEELPSANVVAPESPPTSLPVDGTNDVLPSPDGAEAAPGEADTATPPETPTSETPTPPPAPEQSPADASAAALPAARIVVRADRDSWVEIRDAQDAVVVQRVLRQGETFNVPDEPGLVMNTGNAGGVVIELDGRPLRSLGSLGVVKRGIQLDPTKLLDGTAF